MGRRVVAADLHDSRGGQPIRRVAAVEERVEGLRTPGFQGVENALGVASLGIEGIIEKLLQVQRNSRMRLELGWLSKGNS
jgi:hypothetical protein